MEQVGVLRKQVGGMEPELIQTGGGTPQIQFRTPIGRATQDRKMPLRADPKRGITSRDFREMSAAQERARSAADKIAELESGRKTIKEIGDMTPREFDQHMRRTDLDIGVLKPRVEAAEPRTFQEKYGVEAAQRAPAAQQEAAYGRGGVGGVTGRGVGTALAGAYGGLQALLALNRASASGQDFASGLGGAALQGLSSYQTTAPTAQDIGGEVGSRVAVRGGQMMDDRAEERAKGPGRSDAVSEAYRNTAKRMAAQTAEPTVAVQRTPRPRLTPSQIEQQRRLVEVRRHAEEERRIQDADAAARARGNVPVLGPTAPPPAAPAPPASSTPMTMDNSSQSQVGDWYKEQQKTQMDQQKEEQDEAKDKVDPLKKLTDQAQQGSVQGGF